MKHSVEFAVVRTGVLRRLRPLPTYVRAFVIASFAVLPLAAASAAAQAGIDSVRLGDSVRTHPIAADTAARDTSVRYRPESLTSFAMHTIGPVPLLRSTAMAGFDQWRRQPVHWTQTSDGFRDRLDSRLGGEILGHTIRFAFERALREQPAKYHGCECLGFEPRLAYALLSPLRVETPHGQQLSAIAPLGIIVSGLAVTSVQPGGFSLSRGLQSGATGVASAALNSVVREFWPWHWRPPGL